MKRADFFFLSIALSLSGSAYAGESTTYAYDELGRLISSSNTGGPRSGKVAASTYDPSGNRSSHAVGQATPPPPNAATFAVTASTTVSEGGAAIFTVTKSGQASVTMTVSFATVNGTASAPADFTAVSGVLSFLFWETQKQIMVPVNNDGIAEGVEQFSLTLSSLSPGATLATPSASISIDDSGSANRPPITTDESVAVGICTRKTINVVANDTDPEGNYPLAVVAISRGSFGTSSISGTTSITYNAFGGTGGEFLTYTVRDSLGATSTGLLAVNIVDGQGCL